MNYIVILKDFIKKLKLTGNELVLFSLIYGFNQDGKTEFYGSLNYISDIMGTTKVTTISLIKKLIAKKYILKSSESRYILHTDVVKFLNGGSKETILKDGKENIHNIYNTNNNTNNKTNTIVRNEKIANEIYNYYINRVKLYGTYNMEYNKKKLAISRILDILKKYSEKELKTAIGNYIRENSKSLSKGYIKMVQYFFGKIDKSKIYFFEEFLANESLSEVKKDFIIGF